MGRTRLRFCLNGHDTWECGRYPNSGRCRQCQRDSSRESKHNRKLRALEHLPLEAARAGLRATGAPRLPWEPLRAELAAAGRLDCVSVQSRRDWGRRGIPPITADTVSCRVLHKHPVEIFGQAWFDA